MHTHVNMLQVLELGHPPGTRCSNRIVESQDSKPYSYLRRSEFSWLGA